MSRTVVSGVALAAALAALLPAAAGAQSIRPNPNKPPQVYDADQQDCRVYAEHTLRYGAPPPSGVSPAAGALTGLAVGAIVGDAVGHRSGALVGAAAGATIGAVAASSDNARRAQGSEAVYEDAFNGCMRAHGNLGPEDPEPPPPPPPPR